MNFSISLIKHEDADASVIDRVIALKQCAWPYPKESQIRWIDNNLNAGDVHVFLDCDGESESVAYLNLVQIHFMINDKNYDGFGIGNVCAKIRGKGYGNRLISLVNSYLDQTDRVGLLFCHSPLIKFYSGCKWELLHSDRCLCPKLDEGIFAMTYNAPDIIDTLYYKGKLF